jgi:GTP1/Obg family GTP-binding protein
MAKDWKKIHLSFTENLKKEWKVRGFTYDQTKQWIKIGKLVPTDYEFAKWLKGVNHNPEEISNDNEKLEKLRKEHQEIPERLFQDSSSQKSFSIASIISEEESISQEQAKVIGKKIREKSALGTSIKKIIPFSTPLKNYSVVISRGLYYANWLVSYGVALEEEGETTVEVLKRLPTSNPASGYATEGSAFEAAEKIKEEVKNQDELTYLRNVKLQLEKENKELKENLKLSEEKFFSANKEIDQLKKEISQLKRKADNTRNILLIGRTGKGKSTLANVLTGNGRFKEGKYGASETRNIKAEVFEHEGVKYRVIDTVGIGDTKLTEKEVLDKLAEAAYAVKDGLHQVLFVSSGRFDEAEVFTYNLLRKAIFDENITDYTTIVRTSFPDFEDKKECQNDINVMKKENKSLAEVIMSCNEIVHVENHPKLLESRSKSRVILLKRLVNCQNVYEPQNLKELNRRIGNAVMKKIKLEEDLTILKRKSGELGDLDSSLNERIKNLEEEIEKQKKTIRQETKEHIEEKGINWEKWASIAAKGIGTTATLIAAIVSTGACRIM